MSAHTSRPQRGFTLIEISVALVVVGLLIGGVLAARSMMHQSRINSVVAEADKYKAALASFQAKYNALPGDMGNATKYWGIAAGTVGSNYTYDCYNAYTPSSTGKLTCNGNGDKNIEREAHPSLAEMTLVWQHMVNAGMIAGSYTGQSSGGEHVPGQNCPRGPLEGSGWGVATITGDGLANLFFEDNYGVVLSFGAFSVASLPRSPVLATKEALGLDTKYDNGLPGTGSIRTAPNGGEYNIYEMVSAIKTSTLKTYDCASTSSASTAVYDLTKTGPRCNLYFLTGL